MNLTERQNHILSFIRSSVDENGYPPSVREIGIAVGLASTSTVHGHLDRLEKRGMIRRASQKSRALELVNGSESGSASLNSRFSLDQSRVDLHMKTEAYTSANHRFGQWILPVQTTMFTGEGSNLKIKDIFPGDHVIVEKLIVAEIGDVLVVMSPYDETSMFFYIVNEEFLQSPNKMDVHIVGKVTGILRLGFGKNQS